MSRCCEPSSSIIKNSLGEQKSAKNGPIGNCLRNLMPHSCPPLRRLHNFFSASVCARLSCRARSRRKLSSATIVVPRWLLSPAISNLDPHPRRRRGLSLIGRGENRCAGTTVPGRRSAGRQLRRNPASGSCSARPGPRRLCPGCRSRLSRAEFRCGDRG